MQLELGKTYHCRNGAKVKINRFSYTGTGKPDRAYGTILGPGGGDRANIVYYAGGQPVSCGTEGYTISGEVSEAGNELMFSFKRPSPEHSVTVSESKLREYIKDARNYGGFTTICDAAERMIEMAKAPKPVALPRLNPTISIRRQIAEMLEEIGLEPTRFLNNPEKDIKPMCNSEPTPKAVADQASRELVKLMTDDLGLQGVVIPPVLFRLWLVERWDQVSKLAHKIHNGET